MDRCDRLSCEFCIFDTDVTHHVFLACVKKFEKLTVHLNSIEMPDILHVTTLRLGGIVCGSLCGHKHL